MGLEQVQAFLARLYTDPALRERFIQEPQAAAEAFDLSADEVQHLARLAEAQITFFADGLRRKRSRGVAKLLPLTERALGDRFEDLFGQYADAPIPFGTKKHRADALGFAAFVEKAARQDRVEPSWAVDVLRYEAARLTATVPTSYLAVRWLRGPAAAFVRQAGPSSTDLSRPGRPALALWLRLFPRGRLWRVRLALGAG